MPFSRGLTSRLLLPLVAILGLLLLTNINSVAATPRQQSDNSAIAWAMKAMTALTGGMPINSATLTGTVDQVLDRVGYIPALLSYMTLL